MIELAPDAMIIVDVSGTILYANLQLTALLGCERDQIINCPVEHLPPERFRGRHRAHRQHFVNDGRPRPMSVGLDLLACR